MKTSSLPDNFEFDLVGTEDTPFIGYVSSRDKTNLNPGAMIRGSKNVYKKLSGTIANRPGLLRRGEPDATSTGITSSWEWYNSLNKTLPLRVVADGRLQVESDIVTDGSFVWYDLLTGLTNTRFVFDAWWDNTNKKDTLLMVNHESNIKYWSGGIAKIGTATANTLPKLDTATTWLQDGFNNQTLATIGGSTTQFDITNTSGTTYRYTWDTTGTDPAITATSVPVGSYVLLGAQNFATANNGLFLVTGSGVNYFEVTNASGTTESNKTIGTGFIYTNFLNVLKIGSKFYAYTGGVTTTTLTGVTPDPSAEVSASVAIQAVITKTLVTDFLIDFVKVINNQAFLGSYTSRLCYVSSNSDFTNYTIPTPAIPGSPDLLTLDNSLRGITVREGNPHISAGVSDWYKISYENITVGTALTRKTNVEKLPTATLAGAYAHEFIDTVGDDIVYLSQDQQLRTLGTYRNIFTAKFPCLSQAVFDEFTEEDFTGGHLRAIGDFIYITAPNNGHDWMHQTRTNVDAVGNITAERLWHAPQIRNISRFAVIDGVIYGHSNANPQIYQVWDTNQWHDDTPNQDGDGNYEQLGYVSVARMAYQSKGRRQGLLTFDKAYWEGYLTSGTQLDAHVYYDYQGATNIQNPNINSIKSPAYVRQSFYDPSLGQASLGDNPLGEGLTQDTSAQEQLSKYKVITDLNPTDCFEYSLEIYSENADDRWELLCCAVNAMVSDSQVPFIRK